MSRSQHWRSLAGQVGGLARQLMPDAPAAAAKGRANGPASVAYWEARLLAEGVTDPAERQRLAPIRKRHYFKSIQLKSAVARRHAAKRS